MSTVGHAATVGGVKRRCDCPRPGCCAHCTLLSIPAAAEAVGRDDATIRQWIRDRGLTAHGDGRERFVLEADLLECERAARHAAEASRWTSP